MLVELDMLIALGLGIVAALGGRDGQRIALEIG